MFTCYVTAYSPITSDVVITITVRPTTGGKKVLTKQYRGYHFVNGSDLPPKIWKDVLGQAIAESVKRLSTERDLAPLFTLCEKKPVHECKDS